jgi:hypothetical protein
MSGEGVLMRAFLVGCLLLVVAAFPARAQNSTVNNLQAASTLTGAETLYCVQAGADRKCTVSQLAAISSGLVVGTTVVAGGVSGRIEYNNGGVLGELATSGSGNVVLTTSPTIASLTVTGAFTATGLVTLADIATQATNTVLVNATSGSASPTAQAVSSCSAAADALIWTTNTGFGCNTSITANAVPAANLTGATLASGVTASSLTSVGTLVGGATGAGFTVALTTSTITGLLTGTNGGTGVNNGSKTITLGASLTTTGATATTLAFGATGNTYTFPNASDTLVMLTQTQMLTNKTLASPTVTGAFTATGLVTNGDLVSPTVTVNSVACTLGSTCTISAAASLVVGSTTVSSGTTLNLLYNNAGVLGNETIASILTAGAGIAITGTTNATIAITQGQLPGIASNTVASAGNIGELISSNIVVGSAVGLSNGTPANVTSIALTAGHWQLYGSICFAGGTSTSITSVFGAINGTTATLPTAPGGGAYMVDRSTLTLSSGQDYCRIIGQMDVYTSGTPTEYLVVQANFTVSTLAAFGYIAARRVQ